MNMIRDHIEYLKDNPEGYWFKRKLYGYGWTPATKEGWLVLAGYLLFVAVIVWGAGSSTFITVSPGIFAFAIILATIFFLVVVYKKGESPKWQWGKKSNNE